MVKESEPAETEMRRGVYGPPLAAQIAAVTVIRTAV